MNEYKMLSKEKWVNVEVKISRVRNNSFAKC